MRRVTGNGLELPGGISLDLLPARTVVRRSAQ
jgi:hypothetical protein